jgi:hypothetical protein
MKQNIIIFTVLLLMAGCVPQGTTGPEGRPGKEGASGPKGQPGPQGEKGSQGIAGKSFPKDQLKKFETFLTQNNGQHVVGIESYSFGLAPRITGFCFLTSHGRIFKLENKNTQVLGESIVYVGKIADRDDFTGLSRIAYGEDIKQYFSAVTKSGMVFTTEDLITWKSRGKISLE